MSRFLRFPNGKSKAVTLSYDDCNLGIVKLVEIMQKYGVKGTFNLNSGRYACNCFGVKSDKHLTEEQLKACLLDSGMEIAVHGYKHLNPATLTGVELYREFCVDKENLENVFGGVVRGVAYAFGGVTDKVVCALDNMGFAYARTVKSTLSFDLPTDWLRLNPTCHHDDSKLKELTEYFVKTNPDEMGGKKDAMLFYVWGHANEFIDKNNWQVIEELCSAVGNKDDIWCATNIEIYDYIKAFNDLRFSADGKTVLNNSAFDVWFCTDDGQSVTVKAGTVVNLNNQTSDTQVNDSSSKTITYLHKNKTIRSLEDIKKFQKLVEKQYKNDADGMIKFANKKYGVHKAQVYNWLTIAKYIDDNYVSILPHKAIDFDATQILTLHKLYDKDVNKIIKKCREGVYNPSMSVNDIKDTFYKNN